MPDIALGFEADSPRTCQTYLRILFSDCNHSETPSAVGRCSVIVERRIAEFGSSSVSSSEAIDFRDLSESLAFSFKNSVRVLSTCVSFD